MSKTFVAACPFAISLTIAMGLAACRKPQTTVTPTGDATIMTAAADRSLKDIDIGKSEIALKLTVTPTFETPVCVEAYIGESDSRLEGV